jgi:hypothetical protein
MRPSRISGFRIALLVAFFCIAASEIEGAQTPGASNTGSASSTHETSGGVPALKWATECSKDYCLISADALVNDSDHPADPNHPEYISIIVEISRANRKPVSFAFGVPPDANKSQGVLVTFANSVQKNGQWHVELAKGALSQLDFTNCSQEFCMARVHAEILGSDGKVGLDLLDQFLHRDFVLLMFTRKGQAYRAMRDLPPFQDAYKHLMENELKPTGQ